MGHTPCKHTNVATPPATIANELTNFLYFCHDYVTEKFPGLSRHLKYSYKCLGYLILTVERKARGQRGQRGKGAEG